MILAHGLNGEIGKGNGLLWDIRKDLDLFKQKTIGDIVLMGKNTYDSIPFKDGFPERENWILSSTMSNEDCGENVHVLRTVNEAGLLMRDLQKDGYTGTIWIVGGASIYRQFESIVDEIHVTEVLHNFPKADTFYKPSLLGMVKESEQDVSSNVYHAVHKVYVRAQKKMFSKYELSKR